MRRQAKGVRGPGGMERVSRAAAVPELKVYVGKVGREKSPDIDDVAKLTTSNVTRQLEPFDIDRQGYSRCAAGLGGVEAIVCRYYRRKPHPGLHTQ